MTHMVLLDKLGLPLVIRNLSRMINLRLILYWSVLIKIGIVSIQPFNSIVVM